MKLFYGSFAERHPQILGGEGPFGEAQNSDDILLSYGSSVQEKKLGLCHINYKP